MLPDRTLECEFPSSEVSKFPDLQVSKFPSSEVPKTSSSQVPKFPELQVSKFPLKKKVAKKTNEKLSRLIDRPNPVPHSPGGVQRRPVSGVSQTKSTNTIYFYNEYFEKPLHPLTPRPTTFDLMSGQRLRLVHRLVAERYAL